MTAVEYAALVDGQGPYRARLKITTDMIDVSTLHPPMMPNHAWEFTDSAGHFHGWTKDGHLPTLNSCVKEYMSCPDPKGCGCDGHDVWMRVCRVCGEEVEPAYVPDERPQVIPGRTSWEAEVFDTFLELRSTVSIVFSCGTTRFFGFAMVLANGYEHNDSTRTTEAVTALVGSGELGRLR